MDALRGDEWFGFFELRQGCKIGWNSQWKGGSRPVILLRGGSPPAGRNRICGYPETSPPDRPIGSKPYPFFRQASMPPSKGRTRTTPFF